MIDVNCDEVVVVRSSLNFTLWTLHILEEYAMNKFSEFSRNELDYFVDCLKVLQKESKFVFDEIDNILS